MAWRVVALVRDDANAASKPYGGSGGTAGWAAVEAAALAPAHRSLCSLATWQKMKIASPVLPSCAASLAPQSMFADLNICAADDVQVQREQLALAARLGAGA